MTRPVVLLALVTLPAVSALFFNLGGGGGGGGGCCCPQPACAPVAPAASCCGGAPALGGYGASYAAPAPAFPSYSAVPAASYAQPAAAPLQSYSQAPIGSYVASAPAGGYAAPQASYSAAPVAPSYAPQPSGYAGAPQAAGYASGAQVLPAVVQQEQPPFVGAAAAASGGKLEEVVDEEDLANAELTSVANARAANLSLASEPNPPVAISQLKLTNDTECNSEELRGIVAENMSEDLNTSKRLIQLAAEAKFGGRFDVVCSANDFSYVTNTELFCQETQERVSCYAYRQL